MESKIVHSGVKVRGFYRIHIEDPKTGKIVGNSGWKENRITNLGFGQFLVDRMDTGTVKVLYMAVGEGGEPAEGATALAAEVTGNGGTRGRKAITFSKIASKTAQFVATFGSSDSFVSQTESISNVGLFEFSSVGSGQIFAGNDYASSTVATNQNVNVTYQIRFTTT